MKMKRLVKVLVATTTGGLVTMTASLMLAVFSSSPAAGESLVCGTALLRDVEVVTVRVPQSTVTSVNERDRKDRKSGQRDVDMFTTPPERQSKTYRVTVRLNDLDYTGQSSGDEFWDFDPSRLVINDPIDACVSTGTLRLRRPDGKDYKSKIVRVVRDGVRAPTQEGSGK